MRSASPPLRESRPGRPGDDDRSFFFSDFHPLKQFRLVVFATPRHGTLPFLGHQWRRDFSTEFPLANILHHQGFTIMLAQVQLERPAKQL